MAGAETAMPLVLIELVAERREDVLAGLGVEQLDRAGEHVDVLVALAGGAAAALGDLHDEDGGMDGLDGTHAFNHARAAHVGLDLNPIADHLSQLLVDLLDVVDCELFHL